MYKHRQADGTAPTFKVRPTIRRDSKDAKTLVFHCSIVADPKPTINWFNGETKLTDNTKFQVMWPFQP